MKLAASHVDEQAGPFLVQVGSLVTGQLEELELSVPTLKAAARAVRAYIVDEGLGSRDWVGGQVRTEEEHVIVAFVSYNGRVWRPHQTMIATDGKVRSESGHELVLGVAKVPVLGTEFDLDA